MKHHQGRDLQLFSCKRVGHQIQWVDKRVVEHTIDCENQYRGKANLFILHIYFLSGFPQIWCMLMSNINFSCDTEMVVVSILQESPLPASTGGPLLPRGSLSFCFSI